MFEVGRSRNLNAKDLKTRDFLREAVWQEPGSQWDSSGSYNFHQAKVGLVMDDA
jgi:hypothetical protein